MSKRMIAIAITLGVWPIGVRAESAPIPSVTPVRAMLTGEVASRFQQPGTIVHAQVAVEWSGPGCLLRKGAILEGQILSVVRHSKTVQKSEISLAFTRAQCGHRDMSALNLTLVAVAAPPPQQDLGILNSPLPLGNAGNGPVSSLKMSERSLSESMATIGRDGPQLANLKAGDVVGISRLKLTIPCLGIEKLRFD
jgi:hypothetical protein